MDYGDTASIISSAFTDFDDTGNDEDGLDQQEPREMKYVPPVKTEVDDLASLAGALGEEDDDDDHFLKSFNTSTWGNTDASAAREDAEDDEAQFEKPKKRVRKKPDPLVTSSSQKPKPKSKQKPQERDRSGGKPKQTARQERNASSKREKRALMSAEEKEKIREKWKLEKQRARQMERERRLEEKKLADLEASLDSDKEDETLSSRRPSRRAKLKPVIKDEPESDDEDFKPKKSKRTSTPKSSTPKSSTPRKSTGSGRVKVDSMTSDEKEKIREKWREEARARRARNRGPVKTKADEDPDFDDETEKKRKARKQGGSGTTAKRHYSSDGSSTSRHSGGTSGRRKKVENMTEEEREAFKAKWREEARIKRARQRQSMTPEQREEQLRVQREKRREQRAMAKATLTEQDREEEKRKARERIREKRALMTPEERKERVQKVILRRIERIATMSETEQNEYRMKRYMDYVAKKGTMTAEEVEERKRRALEYARRRSERVTAEDLERRKVRWRQYRDSMTQEKRARFLERVREYNRRRVERLQKDPEKWEAEKKRRKYSNLKWRQHLVDLGIKTVRQKSQKKSDTTPKRRYTRRKVPPNETPEQKAERIRESRKLAQKRIKLKKQLEKQKLLEGGHSVDEIQKVVYKNPEKREQTLMRARINRAKRILRGRLEGKLPPEEILQRLTEVEQTYQPSFVFRPYKPRPQAWKPIDPRDLALLEEEQDKDRRDIISGAEATPKKEPPQPQASSSKTPTAGRRERSPKNVQLQQQQQQSPQSDRLSVATPEPINYARTAHQPQFQSQQYRHHTANQYTASQYYAQQTLGYTPHLPQQPQTQTTQAYSLQHILDGIVYQESGSHGPAIVNQTAYHQQHDTNCSSHHDYASSFDNHSPPPASPPGHHDDDEYFGDAFGFSRQPPQDPSAYSANPTVVQRKRGPTRKDNPSRRKKGGKPGQKPGPRGPQNRNKAGVVHDAFCDECGNAYKQSYLAEHKFTMHNPNYRDQTCQICFEKFTASRQWYQHYFKTHHTGGRAPGKEKPHMCDVCGSSFTKKGALDKHRYYIHGEGSKKENFMKCPVCPGEVLMKEMVAFRSHMKRNHPDYNPGGHDCYRCEQSFPNDVKLSRHVEQEHPESYFPCVHCNACRFTAIGLTFHFFRCKKVTRPMRDEMRKAPGTIILGRELLPCEFCKRKVTMTCLTRHYWEMHNVKEDNFTCTECNKDFRVREYWAVHMEEKHQKTVEQVMDLVKCLCVKSREGLEIKNPDGVKGGVPGNTPAKSSTQRRIELEFVQGRSGGRRAGQKQKKDDEIIKLGARELIVVAEEEEQLGLEQASESISKTGKKRGGRPSTKAASKGNKYEDEEEEDDWSESGSDDDDEYQPTIRADSVTGRRTSSRSRCKSKHTFRESDSSAEESAEQEDSEEDSDDEDQILKAVIKQEIE